MAFYSLKDLVPQVILERSLAFFYPNFTATGKIWNY